VAEIVYPPVIGLCLGAFRALDLRITVDGADHVPRAGGCVLASTHVSYLDFIFVGLAARPSRRLVRFLAKKSTFDHRVSGPLMRGMHHIRVDRAAGAGAYEQTLRAVTAGEVVGVFPEATISRSFEVKELKTGAARLALAAGAPLVPVSVWGGQRLWTKGRRPALSRHLPVTIAVGPPVPVLLGDDPATLTVRLGDRLRELLHRNQDGYPDSPLGHDDAWWQPARLGGTAPTVQQARELDAAEYEDRMRR
jgi:1-acyl-sn-glycerol-3-phosphate acyltransferase